MNKIGFKHINLIVEIVSIVVTLSSITVAVYFGNQNKKLESKQLTVRKSTQTIQEWTMSSNYALPPEIAKEIDTIAEASGETMQRLDFKR